MQKYRATVLGHNEAQYVHFFSPNSNFNIEIKQSNIQSFKILPVITTGAISDSHKLFLLYNNYHIQCFVDLKHPHKSHISIL